MLKKKHNKLTQNKAKSILWSDGYMRMILINVTDQKEVL